MHSHSGRVMLDGISFYEDQILRVGWSPKIESKGMAQRHGTKAWCTVRVELLGWDSDLFKLLREQAVLRFHVQDGTEQHGWKNAWDAEAEAARLGQSLHEWRAGRTSSEVSGQG